MAADIDRVETHAVVIRIREHHHAVHELLSTGGSISGISRSLRLDRKTVSMCGLRRWLTVCRREMVDVTAG
jgi:hypothetical protein